MTARPSGWRAGGQVRIAGKVENPLLPGRYYVDCFVFRQGSQRGALQVMHLPDFVVFGTEPGPGLVSVRAERRGRRRAGARA